MKPRNGVDSGGSVVGCSAGGERDQDRACRHCWGKAGGVRECRQPRRPVETFGNREHRED